MRKTKKAPGVFSGPRFQDLEAATRTIGDTAEGRLRWVTAFAREPLPQHSADLTKAGDCLLALAWPVPPHIEVPPPLTRETVATLHNELGAVLGDLVIREGGPTVFPVTAPVQLYRLTAMYRKPAMWATSRTDSVEDPRTAVLQAVRDCVLNAGERLLACRDEDCAKPFVGRKRQEYCSEKCSQRARNRRNSPKRRKGSPQ